MQTSLTNPGLSFLKIDTLTHFESCFFDNTFSNTRWKFLVLDFDQTLVKANTYLGSEDWYKFVTACNKSAIDLHYDAHYKWSIKVREFVAYES